MVKDAAKLMRRIQFKALTLCIASFIAFPGCNALKTKVYQSECFKNPVSSDSSYVIIGQEIGEGNLERISYALHINGNPLARSKGIQIPDAADVMLIAPNQIDFLQTGSSRHGYRIWEISPEDINPESRAIVFLQAVTNQKTGMMKKRFQIIGLLNTWMAPVELGDESTFKALPFELSEPGVYYLGDAFVSGNLKKEKDGTKTIITLTSTRKIQSNPESAIPYLKGLGISTGRFYDLSGQWKQLPITSLADYKRGEPALYYAFPE